MSKHLKPFSLESVFGPNDERLEAMIGMMGPGAVKSVGPILRSITGGLAKQSTDRAKFGAALFRQKRVKGEKRLAEIFRAAARHAKKTGDRTPLDEILGSAGDKDLSVLKRILGEEGFFTKNLPF